MPSVEASRDAAFLAKRPARRAGRAKPRADLHRPGPVPLTGSPASKRQLGLCESDVLAYFKSDASRTPFPRVSPRNVNGRLR